MSRFSTKGSYRWMNEYKFKVGNFFICVHSRILWSMRSVSILEFPVYFRNDPIKISEHTNARERELVSYQLRSVSNMKKGPRALKAATAT